jgi:8-amino-7-oxononanoate synthase
MIAPLNYLQSPIGSKITDNDKIYLYFGGTAYLGIPQSDDFLKLYLEGLKKYGINNGTSRGNNVQLGIYDDAETCAAKRFGAEAALITSSGYLAAQLAVKYTSGFGEVRYAPETHPALWNSENPKVNQSFNNWALDVVLEINQSQQENWVLITNSMNNLYPERYDFSFIKKLNKKVLLIIDDSHGIGVNNNGLGVCKSLSISANIEIVVVASMAKALGVDAGLILGSEKIITLMKQSNEFLGASPPAAAGLYAFMHAEEIYDANLAKLKNNMNLLANQLAGNENWNFITDFPVYLAKNTDLSRILKQKGVLISSFPYPDKDGPMINRVVLSSWHNTSDIKELITALN